MSIYVTFRSKTGIYHIAVLSQSNKEKEHDRTLCRKDLSTRNKESIWKTLTSGVEFFDTPPKGMKLCQTCESLITKTG